MNFPFTEAQMHCDDPGCVQRHGGTLTAFPTLEPAALEECDYAAVIVTPSNMRYCAAAIILDEFKFWHHGSHAIYQDNANIRIESSRPGRVMRPWSVGWQKKVVNNAATLGAGAED